jgi:adenine-specific DNA-methyltransferase
MQARHELVWQHKNQVLLEVDAEGRPVLASTHDLSPRPLVEFQRVGRYDPDSPTDPLVSGDNLLIRGNNLLALNAIEARFAETIKCVYIDPPFNTGNMLGHYEDEFEDDLWLSLMKPRLEALKRLLRPRDGVIAVHIDHRELAPLKLLMDETFGKQNLVSLVTLRVKDPAGVGQQSLIFDVCEYLLLYARDTKHLRLAAPRLSGEAVPVPGAVKGYRKALIETGEAHLVKTVHRPQAGDVRIYRFTDFNVRRFGKQDSPAEYVRHFDRMFADYNPGGGMILDIKSELPATGLSCIEYTPTRGRDRDKLTRVYFLNRRILAWLKDVAKKDGRGRILRTLRLTNLWEVPTAQLFAEGGVEFRHGKKPEALVARILALVTDPGDWVLDSFLGSGTTAAVAHKLGRRWIGIENGAHAETHCLPRLKRVVAGADPTGITRQAKWKGGGSFRYCGLENH